MEWSPIWISKQYDIPFFGLCFTTVHEVTGPTAALRFPLEQANYTCNQFAPWLWFAYVQSSHIRVSMWNKCADQRAQNSEKQQKKSCIMREFICKVGWVPQVLDPGTHDRGGQLWGRKLIDGRYFFFLSSISIQITFKNLNSRKTLTEDSREH